MDALGALRLQVEWGADEALDESPRDRRQVPRPASTPGATPPRPTWAPPAAPAAPRPAAAERAAAAATLEELRAAIAGFEGIALRDTATNLVFAAGNPDSKLLIVGDAPNADADRSGDPFAGPYGSYLELMLGTIGVDRAGMMLVPLLPWRPPGDRPPSMAEITACLPFLQRLIAIVAPTYLVTLGPLAARALLGDARARRRGPPAWQKADIPQTHMSIATLMLPSPAVLLHTPSQRRAAWTGLRLLRHAIENAGASN
jgi:uracil-DNA glycosylase family 4